MISTIMFDWDGTIIDTLAVWANGYNTLSGKYGFKKFTPRRFGDWLNLDWTKNFERLGIPKKDYPKALAKVQDYYKKSRIRICPGMKEALKEISKHYDIVVVTNTNEKLVWQKIRKIRLPIKTVVGPIIGKHKPDPAQLIFALKKLKITPLDCVYIGDMSFDIMAAKRAGIKSIGLATRCSFHKEERIRRAKPDYVVNNPKQLIKILKKI